MTGSCHQTTYCTCTVYPSTKQSISVKQHINIWHNNTLKQQQNVFIYTAPSYRLNAIKAARDFPFVLNKGILRAVFNSWCFLSVKHPGSPKQTTILRMALSRQAGSEMALCKLGLFQRAADWFSAGLFWECVCRLCTVQAALSSEKTSSWAGYWFKAEGVPSR